MDTKFLVLLIGYLSASQYCGLGSFPVSYLFTWYTEICTQHLLKICVLSLSDEKGTVPLLQAVSHNHLPLAALLIHYNCSLNVEGTVALSRTESQQLSPLQCAVIRGYSEMCTLLVEAGSDVTHLAYLLTNENVPPALVEDCDLWLWLRDCSSTPQPLIVLCRQTVRHCLGLNISQKLASLAIPDYIVQCILLTNTLQPFWGETG